MAERATEPIRVLIADDLADAREMYVEHLSVAYGMDVRTAEDGEVAVQLAREWQPEVIVMDLTMPRLTGDEATRIIKQDPKTKHIAVLMLTAYGDYGRERSEAAGADMFCHKPCVPPELAALVQNLALARRIKRKPPPSQPPSS